MPGDQGGEEGERERRDSLPRETAGRHTKPEENQLHKGEKNFQNSK